MKLRFGGLMLFLIGQGVWAQDAVWLKSGRVIPPPQAGRQVNETTGKIDAETISLSDYHGLIRLLVAVGEQLDDPLKSPSLKKRLTACLQPVAGC